VGTLSEWMTAIWPSAVLRNKLVAMVAMGNAHPVDGQLLAHRVISLLCGTWSRHRLTLSRTRRLPVIATTDFLALDILDNYGRAVPAVWGALRRT
jgi:hypothetical protein